LQNPSQKEVDQRHHLHIYSVTAQVLVTLEGRKNHNPAETQNFPKTYRPISLLCTTGKLFERLIIRTIQKHAEERNLLNASQFGFRAGHRATLQCVMLADHVTLNFSTNISTVAVFSYIEKAFDTTWHSALLYNLSEIQFSTSLIKLITSFLTDRKFKFSLEGDFLRQEK
jgi:hypothetical protein